MLCYDLLPKFEPRQADQKITDRKDAKARGQRSPEAVPVHQRSGKHRQKVEHSGKRSHQRPRGLRTQSHLLGQVDGQHRLGAIKRKPFEKFERVGDPESPVKPVAQFIEAFGQRHTILKYSVTKTFYFFCRLTLNHLRFFAPESLARPCYFQIGKRSCAPLARPQQFLSWPGYVAYCGGADFP